MKQKRILSTLLSLVMVLSLVPAFALTAFAETSVSCTESDCSGTYKNGFCSACGGYQMPAKNSSGYYEIYNAGELYWFADKVINADTTFCDVTTTGSFTKYHYVTANAVLKDDIKVNNGVLNSDGSVKSDVSGFKVWTPIGAYYTYFKGVFDGQNHTISGLYCSDKDKVGLFSNTDSATIKNVILEDSYMCATRQMCGGIIGTATKSTITNCINKGTISGKQHIGGIVGYLYGGTVKNCRNEGLISLNNSHNFGGLIGNIDGSSHSSDALIEECTNTGNVVCDGYNSGCAGGGFIGQISSSYYPFNVTIKNCCNYGDVIFAVDSSTKWELSLGGFIGRDSETTAIENCCFGGTLNLENDNSGGSTEYTKYRCAFAGEISGTVKNCYCDSTKNTADMVGKVDASKTVEITGQTTEQFKSGETAYLLQGTQTGSVWGQSVGDNEYPTLGGTKVCKYEYNGVEAYSNEVDSFKVVSVGADKKSATVTLNEAGTYLIVLADYENNSSNNIKTFKVTVSAPQAVRVISDTEINLSTGDKVMIWGGASGLTPKCNAYVIQ